MNGARTLLLNGLAQNDVDMNHFRLLNLDTSNLPPVGIPPTIVLPASNWLNGWNASTQTWSFAQPDFSDLSGNLTSSQKAAIDRVGTVMAGSWQAARIDPLYLPTLDLLRPAQANVSINNHRITNVSDPIDDTDAVNRRFMDMLLLGLNPKRAVRCATTGPISLTSPPGTIDGVALVDGDRVLVKDQTSALENGIHIYHPTLFIRATDANHGTLDGGVNSANDINRAYCTVLEGAVNIRTSWLQVDLVNHIASDPKDFAIFSIGGDLQAGDGLFLVGNILNVGGTAGRILVNADSIDIDPAYAGQVSITTLGTVAAGIWEAGVIDPAHGGTGADNGSSYIQLDLPLKILQPVAGLGPLLTLRMSDLVADLTLPTAGTLATLDQPETFQNKDIVKRTQTTPTSATPHIDPNSTDAFYITALATAITDMGTGFAPSPVFDRGQDLEVWIKDNGLSRFITWGSHFTASADLPLPGATSPGAWLYTRFQWLPEKSKFVLVQKLDNII